MSILNVFDVSGTGMSAQSLRLNSIASNIANADSVAANPEETYRARYPVFQAALQEASHAFGSVETTTPVQMGGVRVPEVIESQAPLPVRYEPDHPYANEEGYVTYPNVSVVEEMANMISASRSFQVNVEVMNTAKTMAERILTLGQ